ncbi:hypothetical protein AB6A40_001297 [Gnathostoma spinigerum]|uniref:Maturase K n=1 Tax=Gnathostoma spinigerum TaxID=75299 RepID=A0ABD6E3U8_9BILA
MTDIRLTVNLQMRKSSEIPKSRQSDWFLTYFWRLQRWLSIVESFESHFHDVMMKEVGKEFPDWNVTWLQIYMYNFGHGPVEIPRRWQNLSLMGDTLNGNKYIERGGRLMWETFIPFDTTAPWDFRGFHLIYGLLRRYQPACSALLEMDAFKEFMRTTKVDLIVIDHIFQECLVAIASLLNATTVRFSNWPISDLYISPFNIPSNPSSVAITTTASSSWLLLHLKDIHSILHIPGFR